MIWINTFLKLYGAIFGWSLLVADKGVRQEMRASKHMGFPYIRHAGASFAR